MDLLTNPWVIIAIVLAVIIGNIAALKYTANIKMTQMKKKGLYPETKPEKPEDSEETTSSK
ncbi:DUF2897 family protein [Vibrio panuliri]|uniref:DUF2897 domain-containing protein n=1 Tax=Vibrio panuliri TaxID=1381081 RepID=A0ABX3FLI2_9VIBR|nr:DUF2897 family protein [Vibrio panuliri]KAB1455535.1 DUF2897 family protein [Vibrio panuliri]OLQ94765.1 DUF2897 domain-containing protein [Vibrio panuliri]